MADGPEARHRAKVYCLNEDGQWDDRGTGHAAVQYLPAEEAAFIVVMSEEDGATHLLQARVLMEDIYQRQQDTIVSWNEPETGVDYALSFQDPEGCTELWEQICSLQGRPADAPSREPEAAGMGGGGAHDDALARGDAVPALPAPEMRNLQAIAEMIVDVPIFRRAKLVEAVLSQDYVQQLVAVFTAVEDLEATADLHHLFHIFKGLVLLNDTGVYEELLREDLITGVIGALEYDPELSCHTVDHRAFLKDDARFKQVVPIGDPATVRRIHQNFHVGFIKDVVLPRALDDHTFAALNQISFMNNVQIVSQLCGDANYLSNLCAKVGDAEQSVSERHDALRLLQELCGVVKQLQLYNRSNFYRKFVEHGFFEPLGRCLMVPAQCVRLGSIDVLLSTVQHEPSMLRQFVLQQKPECEMMTALVHVLTESDGGGEKPQVAELLRSLLDPEGMEGREQDDILNLFYDEYVHKLAGPIAGGAKQLHVGTGPINGEAAAGAAAADGGAAAAAAAGGGSNGELDDLPDLGFENVLSTQQHVCELLCFCVQKHSYRIKYFILRNNVLAKVLRLARHRDKCLVLSALRFFRTCVGLKDEFYNRYIAKNRCFEPVVMQLLRNRARDNLVHSSILELFEFIRRENIKTLIAHLAEVHVDALAGLNHVATFKGILVRHEQNEEHKSAVSRGGAVADGAGGGMGMGGVGGGGGVGGRGRYQLATGRRAFPDDDEDEAYFNDSDDGADGADGTDGTDGAGGADEGGGGAGGASENHTDRYGDPDAPWSADRGTSPPLGVLGSGLGVGPHGSDVFHHPPRRESEADDDFRWVVLDGAAAGAPAPAAAGGGGGGSGGGGSGDGVGSGDGAASFDSIESASSEDDKENARSGGAGDEGVAGVGTAADGLQPRAAADGASVASALPTSSSLSALASEYADADSGRDDAAELEPAKRQRIDS